MITLYQFASAFGLPSASPLCTKVEAYLRLAELEYRSKSVGLITARRGHVPAIGEADSKPLPKPLPGAEPILDHLQARYGDPLGQGLDTRERARHHALGRMIEEHLYFAMLHDRWQQPENAAIMGAAVLPRVPSPLRSYLVRKISRLAHATLLQQGAGLRDAETIAAFAIKDLQALKAQLGSSAYFGGDRPRQIDCIAYSFLSHILVPPLTSKLRDFMISDSTLRNYVERFHSTYFPDFPIKAFAVAG